MDLVSQDKLDAALAKEHAGVTRERKETLIHHIRGCRPQKREELHKILAENLPAQELAFYREIVVPDPEPETPAPAGQPNAPASAPDAAATAVSEGARAAESRATGRGKAT